MLIGRRAVERGMTIIELMIGIAILALVLMLGLPAFTTMLQNFQIRTASESLIGALQFARTEAIRRNQAVRLQFVTTLDDTCGTSANGPHWIVSRNDPTGACDDPETTTFLEPNVLASPQILTKRSSGEGTRNVLLAASAGGAPSVAVVFNGLGRTLAGSLDTIDISNPFGGACQHAATPGNMRCMRVQIGGGGQIKLCDPKVSAAADSRYCQ